jgi:iron complex outermembrane recepter protein
MRSLERLLLGNAVPVILSALCLLHRPAPAAAAASGSSDSASEVPSDNLAEIVVTAQRREEPLDKVPISVTAFSQKTMDDFHVQSFSDLVTLVPGLVMSTQSAEGTEWDIAIRGIFSGGNAPTTAIYIDETPISVRRIDNAVFSGSPQPNIFDLDHIEVLRGPQGTLFGSSSMGGAIRYITPQPNIETASGYARAELDYTDRGSPGYQAGVAYGAPIVDGLLGFRMSAWIQADGGFIDIEDPDSGQIVKRNANSSSTYVYRPAFTIAPAEGLTITPAAFIQGQHSDAPNTYWLTYLPYQQTGAHVAGDLLPQPVQDNLVVASVAVKYDFDNMSFQSDTSYMDRKYKDGLDFTHWYPAIYGGVPFVPGLTQSEFSPICFDFDSTRMWQQEFRLVSDPHSRITWVAGLYFRRSRQVDSQPITGDLTPLTEALFGKTSEEFTGVPTFQYGGQSLSSYTWFSTVDEQKAIFGAATIEIVPRLKADIGVRVEKSAVIQQQQVNAGPLLGVAYSSLLAPDQSQTPVTPRAALTYQYTDKDMVYVSAAKGYRAGGSNAVDVTNNYLCEPSAAALGLKSVPVTYDSDTLWSYEIGAKDSLFDRRLVIQTSAFYINWSNIQTPVSLPSCAESFTTNRGKAISQGFDLQFAIAPMEGLKIGGSVGYTDTYYPNATYGAPSNGVSPLIIGAGDKVAQVLPWTATANLEYSRDIGGLWNGARSYLRLDYRWLDDGPKADPNVVNYDPATGSHPNQAYALLNIRLGVVHQGLDLSLFVNNATNSDPLLSYTHVVPGDTLYEATAIRPLTAGVTGAYRF